MQYKNRIVHVTLLPDPIEETLGFLKNVCVEMEVNAQIDVTRKGKNVTIVLES
ncbi:hypothetical protein [Peribacillus frigoritolerans]|uniref:hypothetical protein n=1 Tax=Peribacillus castrilensis TaxID=2897690 RepID=UPI002DCB6926|nr:hypothetical protein [Peribacillus castrilensis]